MDALFIQLTCKFTFLNQTPIFYENSRNGLNTLDSQTLEMDVDSCVFVGLLHGLLDIPEHRLRVPELLSDDRGILSSALFCIEFLFYCLPSKKVSSIEEMENTSHPNSFLRHFYTYNAGVSFLRDTHGSLLDMFAALHKNNFWGLLSRLADQKLVDLEKIKTDYDVSTSDKGLFHADKVSNNWNKWIPKLTPYAFLKLAPPHE